MKLNTHLTSANALLPDNDLFSQCATFFREFSRAPGVTEEQEVTYNPENFGYNIPDSEERFYREQYVSLSGTRDYDPTRGFGNYMDEDLYKSFVLGNHEHVVLDMIEREDRRNYILCGDVGVGKSTLLRYLIFFVFPRVKALRETYIPIFIRIDVKDNEIQDFIRPAVVSAEPGSGFANHFTNRILPRHLQRVTQHYTSMNANDDFWKYLETTPGFENLAQDVNDLNYVYGDIDSAEKRQAIVSKRRVLRERPEFHLATLAYIQKRHGKRPLIVIDNVDQLDIRLSKQLLIELFRLRSDYQVRTLTAMRGHTLDDVLKITSKDTLNPVRETLGWPDMVAFTRAKVAKIRAHLPAIIRHETQAGAKLAIPDAESAVTGLVSVLIGDECVRFLAAGAQSSLRRWQRLFMLCVRSGLLTDHYHAIEKAAGGMFDAKTHIPFWVPLTAVITHNHRTFISTFRLGENRDLICNPLCNGEGRHNSYLIRLQLLAYLRRVNGCYAGSLERDYLSMFPTEIQRDANDSLQHAMMRLLNSEAVASSSTYKLPDPHPISNLATISITSYGKLWIEDLIKYFECIVHVKDDIDFGSLPEGIVLTDDLGDVRHKFSTLPPLLEWLFGEEQEFFRRLGSPSTKRRYVDQFSYGGWDSFVFTKRIVRGMLGFAESRRKTSHTVNVGDVTRLRTLLAQCEAFESGHRMDLCE